MEVQDSFVEAETMTHLKSQQSVAGGAKGSPTTSYEMSSAATPHTGQASRQSSLVEATARLRSPTSGTALAVTNLEDPCYRTALIITAREADGNVNSTQTEDCTERRSCGQSSDPSSSVVPRFHQPRRARTLHFIIRHLGGRGPLLQILATTQDRSKGDIHSEREMAFAPSS